MGVFKQISTAEVKEFELIYTDYRNISKGEIAFDLIWGILGWHESHGIDVNAKIENKWTRLTELLHFDPNYYPIYDHKNALWGLEYQGNKILLYCSVQGLTMKASPSMKLDELHEVLQMLKNTIVK